MARMLETPTLMCHNCARKLIPGDKEQTAYEMQYLTFLFTIRRLYYYVCASSGAAHVFETYRS